MTIMYLARRPHSGPLRLVINRALAWAVFLFMASVVLVISYFARLYRAVAPLGPDSIR